MTSELDLISILINNIYDPDIKVTQVLPEITLSPHPRGVRMSHELTGGHVEVERLPAKYGKKEAVEPAHVVTIRIDNVFGRSKTIKLGDGWVQIGDELFEFKGKVSISDPFAG